MMRLTSLTTSITPSCDESNNTVVSPSTTTYFTKKYTKVIAAAEQKEINLQQIASTILNYHHTM